MTESKNYVDSRGVVFFFFHGAFLRQSRTLVFEEVKGQGYLRVRNNRIISTDAMAPGKKQQSFREAAQG